MKRKLFLMTWLCYSLSGFAQQSAYNDQTDSLMYVAKYKGDKTCAISYTFDDGLKEHYTLVFPQLMQLGFKATFEVWAKCIENDTVALGKPRMTWAELREMAANGQEISSHSWSHPNLKRLPLEQVRY